MMTLFHKINAAIMLVGLFLILAGGMSVRRDPSGTWVQVNLVHGVGGALLLCGVVLAGIAAFGAWRRGEKPSPAADRERG